MMKVLIANSVCYLVNSVIDALGVLIEQPLTNWLVRSLTAHFSGAKYRVETLELASNFQSVIHNKMPQ